MRNLFLFFFFFQAEDGIRDFHVTGVQTCALPISGPRREVYVRHEDGALPVVRRIVNWSFERREVCRVTSLLVILELSGSARAGAQPYLGARTRSPATR